jgi:hydrogenase-4 membrane subunit HyfE
MWMHYYGSPFGGMMGWHWFGSIFMWIGIGIYISISILLTYFVHKDAVNRGVQNPEIWIIIMLIFNLIGLLVYVLVRENYKN